MPCKSEFSFGESEPSRSLQQRTPDGSQLLRYPKSTPFLCGSSAFRFSQHSTGSSGSRAIIGRHPSASAGRPVRLEIRACFRGSTRRPSSPPARCIRTRRLRDTEKTITLGILPGFGLQGGASSRQVSLCGESKRLICILTERAAKY